MDDGQHHFCKEVFAQEYHREAVCQRRQHLCLKLVTELGNVHVRVFHVELGLGS